MRVPVKIVVNRMIDAPVVLAAKSEVQRRDAKEILERCVVRPSARNPNPQVSPFPQFPPLLRGLRGGQLAELPAFPDRKLRFRILTSRATSLISLSSVCEPSAPKKPREFVSELMYATACARSSF